MGKNKKSKQVEKVTKSNKKAIDAVKGKKAKPVAEPAPERHLVIVSEHAVEGELPQWGAQLDLLREADIAAGHTKERFLRVERQQRVRQLKKGETLPDHGGLFDLDTVEPEVEIVEPVEVPTYDPPLTKKERKAHEKALAKQAEKEAEVAALRQQAEIAEAAAAEAAELERRNAETAVAESPAKAAGIVSSDTPRTRTDMIRKALDEAVATRSETGERQTIKLPRQYKVKNYQAQLIRKYGEDFPGLKGSEEYDEDTGLFSITLVLPAAEIAVKTGGKVPVTSDHKQSVKEEKKAKKKSKK